MVPSPLRSAEGRAIPGFHRRTAGIDAPGLRRFRASQDTRHCEETLRPGSDASRCPWAGHYARTENRMLLVDRPASRFGWGSPGDLTSRRYLQELRAFSTALGFLAITASSIRAGPSGCR